MDVIILADKLGFSFLAEPWLFQVFLVIVATALANVASRFLLRRAEKMASLTESHWDDALIQSARRPAPILIWLLGIAFASGIIGKQHGAAIFDMVPALRN